MSILVGLICALSLLSLFAATTTQYLPVGALLSIQARQAVKQGITQIDAGMARYVRSNLDAEGMPVLPPAGSDLAAVLVPTYAFLPAPPSKMQWSIRVGTAFGQPAFYACLQPRAGQVLDEETRRALTQVQQAYPGRYFVGDACGVEQDWGSRRDHATYWFIPFHAS